MDVYYGLDFPEFCDELASSISLGIISKHEYKLSSSNSYVRFYKDDYCVIVYPLIDFVVVANYPSCDFYYRFEYSDNNIVENIARIVDVYFGGTSGEEESL